MGYKTNRAGKFVGPPVFVFRNIHVGRHVQHIGVHASSLRCLIIPVLNIRSSVGNVYRASYSTCTVYTERRTIVFVAWRGSLCRQVLTAQVKG